MINNSLKSIKKGLVIGVLILITAMSSHADAKTLKLYALYSKEGVVTKGLFEAAEEIEKRTRFL